MVRWERNSLGGHWPADRVSRDGGWPKIGERGQICGLLSLVW